MDPKQRSLIAPIQFAGEVRQIVCRLGTGSQMVLDLFDVAADMFHRILSHGFVATPIFFHSPARTTSLSRAAGRIRLLASLSSCSSGAKALELLFFPDFPLRTFSSSIDTMAFRL